MILATDRVLTMIVATDLVLTMLSRHSNKNIQFFKFCSSSKGLQLEFSMLSM